MIKNRFHVSAAFLVIIFLLYSGCGRGRATAVLLAPAVPSAATETITPTIPAISTATTTSTIPAVSTATSTSTIPAAASATMTATITATSTTVASVILQSNSYPLCEPTPYNSGNAQIITANSSYTINRVDVMLVNCNYTSPAIITGTVSAQIQGVVMGPSFDIPDGITLANGSSTNTFDVSTLGGCTLVSFYFAGCPVTSGSKFSLVLSGNVYDPGFNFRINNNCLNYANPDRKFVFTHDNINWNYSFSIEYYIY